MAGFLDALAPAALVAARDGRVLLRNSAADRMLPAGEKLADVLGATSHQEMSWEAIAVALAAGEPQVTYHNVQVTAPVGRQLAADVSVRPVDCQLDPAEHTNGSCLLVLIEDVSARISSQRRMAASQRIAATGSLAAQVAHELNNPLDGVLRYLGLAERKAGPDVAKYLQSARDGLLRMAEIIRGLLDRARPWQVAGELAPVQRLLDEAVRVMQPRAHSLGVTVISDFDDAADGLAEGSVFQVFCNILKNALDAMPTGGRVTITLFAEGGGCVATFADTGCGLTAEQAERVFEPFYTTKSPGDGSGLGLALCREILQHLGGSITAEPRPAGGAIFRVCLPLHPASPTGPRKQE